MLSKERKPVSANLLVYYFFFEKREMERYSNYLLLTKITISLEQQKLGLIKTYDKTYVYIYELRNASKFKFIY